ncbi:uncharacterized protein EI90DRAFT_3076333 [Cantharellus anzutake]|uniref:uncharacterized protein n=1 Tax=Cantharellus anzutake TaxID=1750568 RepID=UPI001907535F|nr:uncharacterized protein EI90DRAFT_3076333 [Cantharellus anzutake]KAF8324209.1 hypothetical protein EI90DRAFT_3076333 [Cantharellus anzutake]
METVQSYSSASTTSEAGLGPLREDQMETVEAGLGPLCEGQMETVEAGLGPLREDQMETVEARLKAGLGPLRKGQVEAVLQTVISSTMNTSRATWIPLLNQAEAGVTSLWDALFLSVMSTLHAGLNVARADVVHVAQLQAFLNNFSTAERRECVDIIVKTLKNSEWTPLIEYAALKLRVTESPRSNYIMIDNKFGVARGLAEAYRTRFIGDAAYAFIQHLEEIDKEPGNSRKPRYAKAISIIQSSGTGKSRMLTEVGTQIFTLPICLRGAWDPGYPLSDTPVFDYFQSLKIKCGDNDWSISALGGITSFLAAAHETMLTSLQNILTEEKCEKAEVLGHWHEMMEGGRARIYRRKFFGVVIERANELKNDYSTTQKSPKREDENEDYDAIGHARDFYHRHAKAAVGNLVEFIKSLTSNPLCVTYFDEAHELGKCFWIMLRLLQNQDDSIKMWYIFMGTKSSLTDFAPPQNMISARLRKEVRRLEPPYFALDFDQYAIEEAKTSKISTIGHLGTLHHLAQYGRPLWRAMSPEVGDGLVDLAVWKLIAGEEFNAGSRDHVFAVLAQRICLDPVLSNAEAIELANRSVSHHMRLLAGISTENAMFFTHSPSEPILALGAASILYDPDPMASGRLPQVLRTLSQDLCHAGLIEKGLMGELAARFLLLTARDYAAPSQEGHRNLRDPVPLLGFLQSLFGPIIWDAFQESFSNAFVNFTHWAVTRDFLPEMPPRNLLPNLWARGTILQCCFNQSSIDFLCPIYFGSVEPEDVFDPDKLSGLVVQVKYKKGDTSAENNLRPAGIIRDRKAPLPYLALLMELGTESKYWGIAMVTYQAPKHFQPSEYQELKAECESAWDNLSQHKEEHPKDETVLKKLKAQAQGKQLEMDLYNCYLISARGASENTYPILRTAGITNEFKTFLDIVVPQASSKEPLIGHMRPLDCFGGDFPQSHWMSDYGR